MGTTPGCKGDLKAALARIECRLLVLAPELDLYNPVFAARDVVANVQTAEWITLPGVAGHQSASGIAVESTAVLRDSIRRFLSG